MREKGFTLLEVMAAMSMFSILLAGTVPLFKSLAKRNQSMELRTGAIGAAQGVLDKLRNDDPATFPNTGSNTPVDVVVDGHTFSARTRYCVDTALCTSANTKHLTVEISYDGDLIYSVETVYAQLR